MAELCIALWGVWSSYSEGVLFSSGTWEWVCCSAEAYASDFLLTTSSGEFVEGNRPLNIAIVTFWAASYFRNQFCLESQELILRWTCTCISGQHISQARAEVLFQGADILCMHPISTICLHFQGKSSLVAALSQSDLYIDDKLFATLDPRLRKYFFLLGVKHF